MHLDAFLLLLHITNLINFCPALIEKNMFYSIVPVYTFQQVTYQRILKFQLQLFLYIYIILISLLSGFRKQWFKHHNQRLKTVYETTYNFKTGMPRFVMHKVMVFTCNLVLCAAL